MKNKKKLKMKIYLESLLKNLKKKNKNLEE